MTTITPHQSAKGTGPKWAAPSPDEVGALGERGEVLGHGLVDLGQAAHQVATAHAQLDRRLPLLLLGLGTLVLERDDLGHLKTTRCRPIGQGTSSREPHRRLTISITHLR
jgi:hypothetical protein